MLPASGSELGVALCEALGINPEEVGKITVIAAAGDVARIIVDKALPVENLDRTVATITSLARIRHIKIEKAEA